MSLTSLPAEILHEIGYHIPQWPKLGIWLRSDFAAVHGLLTSCSYLYNIFRPSLYRDIHTSSADLFLLARSLKEDSSLVTLVKTFSIDRTWTCNFDAGKGYTLIKRLAVLPKSSKRHLHPADTETIKLLLLESILIILRQVKKVSINLQAINSSSQFFDSKRWRALPINLLPRLEELEVFVHEAPGWRPRPRDLTQVENILVCPRKLYVGFTKSFLTMAYHQLHLPRLESLDISCEALTTVEFEHLILSCPNLHSFSIYAKSEPFHNVDDWGIPLPYITLAFLVEILGAEQPHLSTLSIHLNKDEQAEWFVNERDTLPDFHAFTRLRYLDIEFNYLWNLDEEAPDAENEQEEEEEAEDVERGQIEFLGKLPRSLEVLRIFCADDRGLKEFNAIAERKHKDFPRLKRLELEMYAEYIFGPDPPTPQLNKLTENLATAGIEVILNPGRLTPRHEL